jgi:hypothetical protein
MRAARNHEFTCVLVWKFDRFARSVAHLLSALDEFHHLGIRFISVQDQVDTESPMGKAMFTIIGAMAELESSLISERVRAGMAAARVRGKHLGRPATPAVPLLTQALEQNTATGRGDFQAGCCLALGEAHLRAGRQEKAHTLAKRALAFARAHQERGNEAYALRLLGDIAVRREPPASDGFGA